MGWSRMRTMLRYKHVFRRVGFMNCMLLLLFTIFVFTYPGGPGHFFRKAGSGEAQHVHRSESDVRAHDDDDPVVRDMVTKREERAVFPQKSYPANHVHPVRPVPPVADVDIPKRSLQAPCPTVRMVEFFGQKLTLEGDPLCQWLLNPAMMADGRFVLYGNKMALLYDVIVDPARLAGGPKGGERIDEVWGQDEQAEYLNMKEGFFTLQCKSKPAAKFGFKDHLHKWTNAIGCVDNITAAGKPSLDKVSGLTIAVGRYEYVNLYHTMTDFYNAFLAMLTFNQHPDNVTVLWVDAHPQGGLDDTWKNLFGKVARAGRLTTPTRFASMAWAAMGYNSPLNDHARPSVSYLDEFRHFFLSRHGVDGGRRANCSSLRWTFIWRRDYTAHPRNKKGRINRKIANEDQLLAAVRRVLQPGDALRGLQLDALPFQQQLRVVADTDVLMGMHGAGLSHTLFLPSHGGLIELYPTYWPQSNRHFRAMAGWRKLHYQTWQNHDPSNEMADHRTYVPPDVVVKMVKEMMKAICGR